MKAFLQKLFVRKKLWRILAVVFTVLTALFVTLSGVANTYAPVINKTLGISTSSSDREYAAETYRYKSDYANLQDMYEAKVALMR